MRATWNRSLGRPEPIRALNRIPERENGEPLVDMRLASPSVRLARDAAIPFCRERVAAMAEAAARALPPGLSLGLVEAWRPPERQQKIYDFFWRSAREAFPHRGAPALRRTVCRFVAPTDQKAPPGHCTGGALDVWLLGADGEPVDVSAPYERFEASATYSEGLAPEAARNRAVLVETMLGQGFSNCRDEWWHYSFGDAGWAVRLDRPECVYGIAALPRSLYEASERLWDDEAKKRRNPFLPAVSDPSSGR